MIVRSLLVTLLFLVALGLTGYLFLQHPEGSGILGKLIPEFGKPRPAPPGSQPPRVPVPEEKVSPPESPVDTAVPEGTPRSPQRPPSVAGSGLQAGRTRVARPAAPEERIRAPLVASEEPVARADANTTLSPEDIEGIVEKRKAIQQRLSGGL